MQGDRFNNRPKLLVYAQVAVPDVVVLDFLPDPSLVAIYICLGKHALAAVDRCEGFLQQIRIVDMTRIPKIT